MAVALSKSQVDGLSFIKPPKCGIKGKAGPNLQRNQLCLKGYNKVIKSASLITSVSAQETAIPGASGREKKHLLQNKNKEWEAEIKLFRHFKL